MDSFLIGLTLKICTSLLMWVMVQYTPAAYADGDSGPPLSFLVPLVLVMLVHEMASNLNFIAVVAFFSKVSDPSIGGSYMTLLNTITNLGSKWTTSLCLYMLPKMTMHVCQANSETGTFKQRLPFPCTMQDSAVCTEHDGVCSIEVVSVRITRYGCKTALFLAPNVVVFSSLFVAFTAGWLYDPSGRSVSDWHSVDDSVPGASPAAAGSATHRLAHHLWDQWQREIVVPNIFVWKCVCFSRHITCLLITMLHYCRVF